MITRVEGGLTYTQTFDAENRLISVAVSGQTTQFIYNGDGNLVKKINPNGSKTLYVGGIYEVDKASGGSVTRTVTYYPVAGAMRINSTLYYILKDHLGSASVITDASGNIVGENRYYPFGETRLSTGSIPTDKLYTSQREMAGLGIYHYQARFYSPKTGRFLSADTIVPSYANPQNLNRYSYGLNNPSRYTDPSGHIPIDCYNDPSYCSNTTTLPGSPSGGNRPRRDRDDEPPGHDYGNIHNQPNPVCLDLAWISCTETEVADYLSRWQYPGQLWWNPVEDGHGYSVMGGDFHPEDSWQYKLGAITVDFGDDPLTISNRTQSTHIFHDGYVERKGFRDADGNYFVTTRGIGTNDTPYIGPLIDKSNDLVGPLIFELMDFEMLIYTTVVETGQYISEQGYYR